nr:polymorphic outer membrane protein middle domain-containing protein [Chlamydia poikilotherma]
MKYPVYWFLISSGLIASTSLSFAQATEEKLTSADSFNGNTAGNNTFTPKETNHADGTNYTCEGDVCIANAGTPTALTNSCFSQTAGDLAFIGKGFSLCFENINNTTKPGAINVSTNDKTLSISGFSLFSCSSCPPETTGKGAITSSGTTTFDNDFNILFKKNCSSAAGGAISCKGLTLKGTSGTANFIENKSTDNGGAVEASGASSIEGNSGIVSFSGNTSAKHGGAIHSNSTTTISNNNRVVFSKNTTTGTADSSGGAIYCRNGGTTPELKLEGNQQLVFSENSSTTSGGAICADKLTISSGGTTIFTNNSVSAADPKGGAIYLDTSGECSLTANLGDIIFDGNTAVTTGSSTKRNAIDLGTNGKFTKLSAKDGFGIFFYDPIANNGETTTRLEINKTENLTNYNGKIVFSGETLSPTEKAIADNLKSSFKQPVTLSSGSLILKDGVTLEAKSFTQTAGSVVIMDVGTTLQTPNADGETITLPNLSINVASFGGGGGYCFLYR